MPTILFDLSWEGVRRHAIRMGSAHCRSCRTAIVAILLAVVAHAAPRTWMDGELVSMEVRQYNLAPNGKKQSATTEDHYIYTVEDPAFKYVVNFRKRIKTPIHDHLQFSISGERFSVIDADRKTITGQIEQRIRKSP
jgi:hypothetical protein